MEFVRKRKVGYSQKTYRVWHSAGGHPIDGQYRIIWRNEVMGVRVRAGYHATVLSRNGQGQEFWSFATARRPFKTFKLAVEACEKNFRLWQAFIAITDTDRKGRADRVRALDAKAVIGSGAAAHKVMSVLPVWVQAKAEPFLIRLLFPVGRRLAEDDECDASDPSDTTNLSPSSGESEPTGLMSETTLASGPPSNAAAEDESTIRPTRRARSKATSSATESRARPAKGKAKARKPPSKKRPAKRSKSTGKS
jgi:hypothetical protein